MKPFLMAFSLFLAIDAGIEQVPTVTASSPDGTRELKVLHLSGTPHERGLQHGRTLRPEIAKIVGLWKEDLGKQAKMDPDTLIRNFLNETSFMPAIKRWTPNLLDEVKGIADGTGLPFETMFAFQLVDELWVYLDKRTADHCSSMGVVRSGLHPTYVAQNMDLEAFRDGFQVVLHIAANQSLPEQFVFTSAGLIAANGVNDRSIAIACNTLMQLSASRDGLPVAFIVRGVLAQTRVGEAVNFIRGIKHASGQNYILGTGDRIYDFEASAGKVVEFRPAADGSVVYHTNHPLVNDDLKPWHLKQIQSLSPEEMSKRNSETRLASVERRLRQPASTIDEGVIKETLRSKDSELHPVCCTLKEGQTYFTFGATIMTLSATPSFEATMGPPDVNPFVKMKFEHVSYKNP
jgi:isopenicillin-N N-acyltransferase-like protein